MTAGTGGYVFTPEQTRELGSLKIRGRRVLRPLPSMHFMRGPIANVLPELINSVPADADVTITDTKDGPGRRTLTITASWEEPRDT